MSRLASEWTASMAVSNDHPEIRRLYANGGGVAQEWLVDQVVKYCSVHGLKNGQVTLADIKCAAAGKVSRPTLDKYIQDLLNAEALECVGDKLYRSRLAERICRSFNGRGNKSVRNCKNSFTPQNAFNEQETPCEAQITLPSAVPDLEKDLSKILKADAPPLPGSSIISPIAAIEAAGAPEVSRQAGLGQKRCVGIADTILSVGLSASNMSIQDLMAMQAVDLDDLDTEAILLQDRQEAALLAANSPARKASARAAKDQPSSNPPSPADPEASESPSTPQTTQRLPKSVIRFHLGLMAESISDFTCGEKEVNAFHKWPVTEAQLVNLKNAAMSHKRKGKLNVGVGAYLYGAVRRASLGIAPTRR
jgi:hypothetical protein